MVITLTILLILLAILLAMAGVDFIATAMFICNKVAGDNSVGFPKVPENTSFLSCMFSTDFENNQNLMFMLLGIFAFLVALASVAGIVTLLTHTTFAKSMIVGTFVFVCIYCVLTFGLVGYFVPSTIISTLIGLLGLLLIYFTKTWQ